jgi:hypothetical protein
VLPLAPTQVTVEPTAGAVVMKWRGTGEDVAHYAVHRKTVATAPWQQVATVPAITENTGWYEWSDTTTKSGMTYIYGVSAVNTYGTQSAISESSAIVAP